MRILPLGLTMRLRARKAWTFIVRTEPRRSHATAWSPRGVRHRRTVSGLKKTWRIALARRRRQRPVLLLAAVLDVMITTESATPLATQNPDAQARNPSAHVDEPVRCPRRDSNPQIS